MILGLLFATISGAALHGDTVYTWGDKLLAWSLPGLNSRVLATPPQVATAGCLDDRGTGLFLQEGDRLVYRSAPHWTPREIDRGIDMHDCLAATLLGYRGILMVQFGMQLRFYEYPDFHYRELYSFYSNSRQGGLLVTDIDGDGHLDILCGNYWIKSPASYELPWHDFAIELYNDHPLSATLRIGLTNDGIIVTQGELPNGIVARFQKPADPKQQWIEQRLGEFHYPRALAGALIGEDNGPDSRLFLDGKLIDKTSGIHSAFPYRNGYVLVSRDRVYFRAITTSSPQ